MLRILTAAALLVFAGTSTAEARPTGRWIGTWARSLMADENPAKAGLSGDTTVRSYVRVSAGAKRVRLRFSNTYGTTPLAIDNVRISIGVTAGRDELVAGSTRRVTFNGHDTALVAPGAEYVSDPVELSVPALSLVAVTYHLPTPPAVASLKGLPGGFAYTTAGQFEGDGPLPAARRANRLFQLSGVEVEAGARAGTIAILGDSITERGGASIDGKGRWPDVVAARLQSSPAYRGFGIVNLSTSGGRLAKDNTGPAGLARMDREVFSQPGLHTIVLFIGVNDLGKLSREAPVTPENRAEVVRAVLGGYRQIVTRARDRGIRVVAVPLLPFEGNRGYRSDADAEADRQQINAWIRRPGNLDGVIDLDAVVRDPARPTRILQAYDSGDHLHPSAAGQDAMGAAVRLDVLVGRKGQ